MLKENNKLCLVSTQYIVHVQQQNNEQHYTVKHQCMVQHTT